jgi:hypothetical protein
VISAAILLGGSAGGGYPADLPNTGNLVFHYDAELGVTLSGGKVASWDDQVGSNHLGNAGDKAVVLTANLNGLDVLSFYSGDGADTNPLLYKDGATLPGATHTWAAVFRRQTTSPGTQWYFSFYGGAAFGIGASKWGVGVSGVGSSSAGNHDGNWHVVVGKRTGGSLEVWLDGASIISGETDTVTSNSGRILIGSWISGSGDFGDFHLAEYLGYGTAEDVDQVGGYLAGKYGLTWPGF